MKPLQTITPSTALALAVASAAPAMAQSDPAGFGTVYNIGSVPPGSIFNIPGAVTGSQVGDGNSLPGEAFITPTFLNGDMLGSNSQLNLFDGGEIAGHFSAGPIDGTGSNIEINIFGGVTTHPPDSITFFDALSGSTVNISGGSVAWRFDAFSGSTINISGGSVGFGIAVFGLPNPGGFRARSGSTVNISEGSVGGTFNALSGSTVNISGGSVGFGNRTGVFGNARGGFQADSGSTVNISGGSVGDNNFIADSGSLINLFGTSFALDGVELTDLVLGEAFTITDRNVTLTGLLADGSAFEYDLNSNFTHFEDTFSTNATLTVTLVPAPGAAGLLTLAGLAAARRRR